MGTSAQNQEQRRPMNGGKQMRVEWSFPTLLLLVTICQQPMVAQRAIPDDNLAYPVFINLTDCSGNINNAKGSGFFLNTGSVVYFGHGSTRSLRPWPCCAGSDSPTLVQEGRIAVVFQRSKR
jgi:hypothetical protein